MTSPAKRFLEEIFRAAVEAVDPARLVRRALKCSADGISLSEGRAAAFAGWESVGNVYFVGGGKAGRAMGEAAAGVLGEKVAAGAIAVPRGQGGASGSVRFIEAGHPYPDGGSAEAAEAMLGLLTGAKEMDLVIALLSGGGSAMISLPAEGISLADKEETTRLLMNAGADIFELNAVRKHLSRVKGGWMARAAHPARVLALLLSDVPGDDPSVIASGPFSPDLSGFEDAVEILVRRDVHIRLPESVRARFEAGLGGTVPETPKPGDPFFGRIACSVIGSNRAALEAAAAAAKRPGVVDVVTMPGFLHGESRDCARAFVAELKKASASLAAEKCAVVIAGGETAVTVGGSGIGGRNQEFALSAAIAMDGEKEMAVLCAGTDGIDGPTDAAGAYADGATCARAASLGLSAEASMGNNDSYPFFRALSDLSVTGPTGTNVADIAIGLAGRPP